MLSENTIMISSVSGQRLLNYQLPLVDMVDDMVINMISPNIPEETYFILLTKRGRLIVMHYKIVDNVTDY